MKDTFIAPQLANLEHNMKLSVINSLACIAASVMLYHQNQQDLQIAIEELPKIKLFFWLFNLTNYSTTKQKQRALYNVFKQYQKENYLYL